MSSISYKNSRTKAEETAELMKLLSSGPRLQIMSLLMSKKEGLCVYELAKAVGLSHSATSHQLAKLEDRGIVECIRVGQTMCYSLSKSRSAKVLTCVLNNLK